MKPKEIDVLFFIEHVDREMKGTLEVKKELEKKGLKVHVTSIPFGLYQVWRRFVPKLVCLPYCKSEKSIMVRLYKTMNPHTIFINLNYEQLLSPATEYFKRPQDDFARHELIHFVWGNHFKHYLIMHGVDDNHIHIVGKPEIQFLKDMHLTRGKDIRNEIALSEGLDKDKRWIFVPFNDGGAFISKKMAGKKVKQGGAKKSDVEEGIRVTKEHIERFFYWMALILKDNKSIEVIYRPHPGVDISNYDCLLKKNGLENVQNFHINRSYTIKEWLCSSQVCLSNWSTTMVDAKSIGVKTYIFLPSILTERRRASWLNGFEPIESIEDLKNALNEKNNDENSASYCEYIENLDNVIVQWANEIEKCLETYKGTEEKNYVEPFKSVWKYLIRSEFRRIAMKLSLNNIVSKKVTYDYFETF